MHGFLNLLCYFCVYSSRNRPVYHNYGDVSNQAFRDDYGYAMSQRGVGGPPGYGKF